MPKSQRLNDLISRVLIKPSVNQWMDTDLWETEHCLPAASSAGWALAPAQPWTILGQLQLSLCLADLASPFLLRSLCTLLPLLGALLLCLELIHQVAAEMLLQRGIFSVSLYYVALFISSISLFPICIYLSYLFHRRATEEGSCPCCPLGPAEGMAVSRQCQLAGPSAVLNTSMWTNSYNLNSLSKKVYTIRFSPFKAR